LSHIVSRDFLIRESHVGNTVELSVRSSVFKYLNTTNPSKKVTRSEYDTNGDLTCIIVIRIRSHPRTVPCTIETFLEISIEHFEDILMAIAIDRFKEDSWKASMFCGTSFRTVLIDVSQLDEPIS